MEKNRVIISGTPPSNIHAYRFTRHGAYISSKGKKFKDEVFKCLKTQWGIGKATKNPVEVWITYIFGDRRRRDIKNYEKLMLDSAEKMIYMDDVQIQKIHLEKRLDLNNPRIIFEWREIRREKNDIKT